MKMRNLVASGLFLALAAGVAVAQSDQSSGGMGQAKLSNSATAGKATVHGKANNPIGQPYADATVFVTTDGTPKSAVAQFKTDAEGNYTGQVPAGKYVFVLQEAHPKAADKEIDDSGPSPIDIPEKSDHTIDFDGSRAEYVKKLSPEERKQIEEFKAKNAAITANNAVVTKLNEVLKQERAARAAGNLDEATQLATQITQGKPAEAIGWYELGKDQVAQKKYDDAIPNLKKALEINEASKKKDPAIEGAANAALGDAYANTKKVDLAAQAYGAAATADPTGAYTYYLNEAIVLNTAGQVDGAAAAADKAIAADPTKAMAYYLKGQALVQKATTDKNNKVVVPPGCVEAYQKYLQLDPNGPHAEEVTQTLEGIGVTVNSKYSSRKK